jgi:hypothetical protein
VTNALEPGRCLNCGAPLHGPFCAACGQRAVPPDPTVRELAGDAWRELSGYDGRIMATIRGLSRPGFLTREYLDGRRAHYLPPVRVYLVVSVIYFVIAASVPDPGGRADGPGGMRITIDNKGGGTLSDEERETMRARLDEAPWYLRPMLSAMLDDQAGYRQRLFTVMPRVFFALLPVFAGIVWLFYRRRTFPTALVFAVHVHAFAFIVFSVAEALKLTGREHLADRVGSILALLFGVYALKAFRAVFGGSWPVTIAKAAAIGFVYLAASVPAFMVILLWASFS